MGTYETTFHLVGLDAEVILVGERVRGVCWVRGKWACVRMRRVCMRGCISSGTARFYLVCTIMHENTTPEKVPTPHTTMNSLIV